MRKVFLFMFVMVISLTLSFGAYAADKEKAAPAKGAAKRPMPQHMDRNFVFVLGTITKIDTSTPGMTKIEITDDRENKSHIIEVTPVTNILKSIDVADLKAGDKARIMGKKVADKEVALSVVTGNLKAPQHPRPQMPPQAAVGRGGQVKK